MMIIETSGEKTRGEGEGVNAKCEGGEERGKRRQTTGWGTERALCGKRELPGGKERNRNGKEGDGGAGVGRE